MKNWKNERRPCNSSSSQNDMRENCDGLYSARVPLDYILALTAKFRWERDSCF